MKCPKCLAPLNKLTNTLYKCNGKCDEYVKIKFLHSKHQDNYLEFGEDEMECDR